VTTATNAATTTTTTTSTAAINVITQITKNKRKPLRQHCPNKRFTTCPLSRRPLKEQLVALHKGEGGRQDGAELGDVVGIDSLALSDEGFY
jgi:hypothetical protein